MSRSIERRLERLEALAAARPKRGSDNDLFGDIERLVTAGHPITRTEWFSSAWTRYLAARDRAAAAECTPPPGYRSGEPDAVRWRKWVTLDHPDLADAATQVLRTVAALVGQPT
jgi:hypothetical protein